MILATSPPLSISEDWEKEKYAFGAKSPNAPLQEGFKLQSQDKCVIMITTNLVFNDVIKNLNEPLMILIKVSR